MSCACALLLLWSTSHSWDLISKCAGVRDSCHFCRVNERLDCNKLWSLDSKTTTLDLSILQEAVVPWSGNGNATEKHELPQEVLQRSTAQVRESVHWTTSGRLLNKPGHYSRMEMCWRKAMLRIVLNTPSVAVASWLYLATFLPQGWGSWSELIRRLMELNTGQS